MQSQAFVQGESPGTSQEAEAEAKKRKMAEDDGCKSAVSEGKLSGWAVVTDIDGTLIDAKTYSHEVSRPTVARCIAAGVPVVLCSAKTQAEQLRFRRELGLEGSPSIAENGAAILVPRGYFTEQIVEQALSECGLVGRLLELEPYEEGQEKLDGVVLGVPASEVREAIADARAKQPRLSSMKGFYDLTAEEVAEVTGLDLDGARRARHRDYSETVCTPLDAEDFECLRQELHPRGINVVCGGRFHSATGAGSDKGRATKLLKALLRIRQGGGDMRLIGLGDAANDAPLLLAVDEPYLVQRPDGSHVEAADPSRRCTRVDAVGPAGWAKAVGALLDAAEATTATAA
eukprot:TRINITY_DN30486_c0_g2_i1.p1 TRINITY_DN30486_c0_g2~~TRINITY_DN30486_c0_g2_i1.p1  ORF type:complete len:360 (+),score=58.34 TRINITY_DN30486_c0_g2_i1:47-1081(+)